MNSVMLTILFVIIGVWVILIGAVFLVGLLSGKQQDNTDEISDDKDVSVLDVDMQDEGIEEQSIAEMNNIVEKESIFTRFLNLMRRRIILPKPSQCLRFIWSKLKRIFVFKTLIILLILWPMLSLGYYLYLDNAISNGVNGPIDYTDVNAYNHPGATRFAHDKYTGMPDRDYCLSLSSLHPDIYIKMEWSGNVFVTDEYIVGSDTCAGWMGKRCVGHYLYFNVWVYLILVSIVFLVGSLSNRAKNKDEKLSVVQTERSYSEVTIDAIGQDTAVEPIKIKSKRGKIKICLISILILWPVLSLLNMQAIRSGPGRYRIARFGDTQYISMIADMFSQRDRDLTRHTLHIYDDIYLTDLGSIRVIYNPDGKAPSLSAPSNDFCGTTEIQEMKYWVRNNFSVKTGFNIYIYLLLLIYVICSCGIKYEKKQENKQSLIISRYTLRTLFITMFIIGVGLFARFVYWIIISAGNYSPLVLNDEISSLGNLYVQYITERAGIGNPSVNFYDTIWIYNSYLGILLLFVPICVFIRNKQKNLVSIIPTHDINKLSKKTIITLCVVFALGVLLLVRYLVLLQSKPTGYELKTTIRYTFLGNVYRDYEYFIGGMNPDQPLYGRGFVWLYNIYLGIATLICPIAVLVSNKYNKVCHVVLKCKKLWNILLILVLINLLGVFCDLLVNIFHHPLIPLLEVG